MPQFTCWGITMEGKLLPTVDQAFAVVRVCQMLSNYYRAMYVFRYDDVQKIVYIQAGTDVRNDEIEIPIPTNGIWEFYQQ